MVTANKGRNEWKIGVESDNTFLHENFNYIITDPSQFDDGHRADFQLSRALIPARDSGPTWSNPPSCRT